MTVTSPCQHALISILKLERSRTFAPRRDGRSLVTQNGHAVAKAVERGAVIGHVDRVRKDEVLGGTACGRVLVADGDVAAAGAGLRGCSRESREEEGGECGEHGYW